VGLCKRSVSGIDGDDTGVAERQGSEELRPGPCPPQAAEASAHSREGSGRAGTPATRSRAATSLITTATAPTTAPAPTVTSGSRVAPAPIVASRPIRTRAESVARGQLEVGGGSDLDHVCSPEALAEPEEKRLDPGFSETPQVSSGAEHAQAADAAGGVFL
jgi:hypothetical protein